MSNFLDNLGNLNDMIKKASAIGDIITGESDNETARLRHNGITVKVPFVEGKTLGQAWAEAATELGATGSNPTFTSPGSADPVPASTPMARGGCYDGATDAKDNA